MGRVIIDGNNNAQQRQRQQQPQRQQRRQQQQQQRIYAGAATTIWNALFEICKTMRFRYSIFGGVLKSIEFLSLALFGFGRENKNR